MKRIRFMHNDQGEIIESDLIIADRAEWNRMPESREGEWAAHSIGGRVLALRLDARPGCDVLAPNTPGMRGLGAAS